jgi:DNA-binding Lrp family transcriptional regulator
MDNLDLQLIDLLSRDGRQGLQLLANQLQVGIVTVGRRIDRLKKQKSIRISAVVDPSKAGSPISVMLGLGLDPHFADAVVNKLGALPSVLTVLRTIGPYDAWASLWFRHSNDISDFIEGELPRFNGIKRAELFHLLRNTKSPYTLLIPGLISSPDCELISLLQEDGRRDNLELADRLGVHPSTVGRSIKRLIENGIIRIIANQSYNDGQVRAFLGIRTEVGSLKKVEEALVQLPQVRWLNTCTGRYDAFSMAVFKDNQEMAEFITHNVSRIDGVELVETSLVTEYQLYYQARHDEYWAEKKSKEISKPNL